MSATVNIPVGLAAERSVVVTHNLTIASFDSRLPDVFATPAMINFMEITAAESINPYLPDGWISVGVVVNVRHLAATPEGSTVRFIARVTEVNDRTITFAVEAHDEVEKIGEGIHVRAPVQLSRFLHRLEKKKRWGTGD